MRHVPAKLPKSRKGSWRKRLVLGTSLLLTAALATPFVFTGPVVRFGLAHSAFRDVPLRFGSASLRPTGLLSLGLTLRDVVIEDTQDAAGKPLFTAASVRIGFGLNEIASNRLRDIVLENVDVTLRPGADSPLPLRRLLTPQENAAPGRALAAAAVAAPSYQNPLWFDQLILAGKLRLEGYEPWLSAAGVRPGDPWNVQMVVRCSGDVAHPQRDISLIIHTQL